MPVVSVAELLDQKAHWRFRNKMRSLMLKQWPTRQTGRSPQACEGESFAGTLKETIWAFILEWNSPSYTGGSFDLRSFCLDCFTSSISPTGRQSRPIWTRAPLFPRVSLTRSPSCSPWPVLLGTTRQRSNCPLWDIVCQEEENQFLLPKDLSLQETKNCWLPRGSGVLTGNFLPEKGCQLWVKWSPFF